MKEHNPAAQLYLPSSVDESSYESITPSKLTLVELDVEQIGTIVETVSGGMKNVQDIYPLTSLQEGILFHRLLNERTDSYVLSLLFELASRRDANLFVNAIQSVVDRHDILRTAVVWERLPRPVQVVYRHAVLPKQELDLGLRRDSLEKLIERMQPGSVALDVRKAPIGLLQVATHTDDDSCYALLYLHHLICDHRSLNMLISETLAFLRGNGKLLPTPVAYRNYVVGRLMHACIDKAEAFFRRKLGDITESTAPLGITDLRGNGVRVKEARHTMDLVQTLYLNSQAQRRGFSIARLLHAAWALVVAHTTGKDTVVYGTVLMCRQQRDDPTQCMLGLSVNTLPIRFDLCNLTARGLIDQAHRELIDLLEYETAPLTLAQRCSGLAANAPLFTTLLNYRKSAGLQIETSSLETVRLIARGESWSNYPVSVTVDDTEKELAFTVQTDARVDPHRIIAYLITALISLADVLDRAPETLALSIPILSAKERSRQIEDFNNHVNELTEHKRVTDMFEEQVDRTPDAIALVCGADRLTYAHLNCRANQVAHLLRGIGVRTDCRVALYAGRSSELVVGLLAILKAGGAYVPLDVSYPTERIAYMLQDSAPVAVLTQRSIKNKLPTCEARVVMLDADDDLIDRQRTENLPSDENAEVKSRGLAYVIYTSGSTGTPKGVMVEHRSLANLVKWHCHRFGVSAGSRCSSVASVSFDAATWEIWPPLTVGGALLLSMFDLPADTEKLLDWWAKEPLSVSFLPTPLAEIAFLREPPKHGPDILLVGGDRLRSRPTSTAYTLINNYGPTEATVVATSGQIEADSPILHIGRPIANARVYILDRYGQLVPIGVSGEICIGGVSVARGYLNRPELTAERFVPDPFCPDHHTRMYKTGDLGRWSQDGTIEYLGRNDHQVKIRGFRIEPAEIEAQLARHPQVMEAVVVARDDDAGERCLVAFLVLTEHDERIFEDLREDLRSSLPEQMIPKAFVTLERFQLTQSGKLDRRNLPAPGPEAYRRGAHKLPQGEMEEMLASIWQSLLRIERVGRHDNFFELGGHSLLIMQMVERLRGLGKFTDARTVYENPTLEYLALKLRSESPGDVPVPPNMIPPGCKKITPQMCSMAELSEHDIEQIILAVPGGVTNVKDIYPLAPLQEGLLFHNLMGGQEHDVYCRSLILSLSSRDNLDKFLRALQAICDRHDILRTAIVWERLLRPMQVVYHRATLPIEEVELQGGRVTKEQLIARMRADGKVIDLRRAPLMRVQTAAEPGSGRYYVVLQTHHLVFDNDSLQTMLREATVHARGATMGLPEPVQYRNHVARALVRAHSSDSEVFFRDRLADIEEPSAPFGLLDTHNNRNGTASVQRALDTSIVARMRIQARRLGVSMAALFHAAWGLVIGRTSGRDTVIFGTVLLGRLQSRAATRDSLGMFINTLPLRLNLRRRSTRELIEHTQQELLAILDHEQASLSMAQHCSGIIPPTPLFSALLNYVRPSGDLKSELAEHVGAELLANEGDTNYPIVLSVYDRDTNIALEMQTDDRLDAHRMMDYICTALTSVARCLEEASQTLAVALPLLPDQEWRKIVESFNATQELFPRKLFIHQLIEEQARRSPDSIAVAYECQSITYSELNAKANRLAHYLMEMDVAADQLVGIYVDRSLELVVSILGVLKAGGAYVPFDPGYPSKRNEYMIEAAAPRVLLTQESLIGHVPKSVTQVVVIDRDWTEIARRSIVDIDPRSLYLSPRSLAYMIYTSGSTGRPKGVLVEHENLLASTFARSCFYGIYQNFLLLSSFAFDSSVAGIFGALTTGGKLTIASADCMRDAKILLETIRQREVTDILCVPTLLKEVLLLLADGGSSHPLKRAVVAGEACPVSLIQLAAQVAPDLQLINEYGPTECTVWATAFRCNSRSLEFTVPIGSPVANARIYILGVNGQIAPIGVAGEICIGGASVARGYMNRPELTAERFVPDHLCGDSTARLYKTGDLGRWRSDGTIEYMGRSDLQVKIRGFRIELEEIEAQLMRHALVRAAVVLAQEDAGDVTRLVAYITPQEHAGVRVAPDPDMLRAYLKSLLPDYMLPSAYVVLDRLPLTSTGKLNRRALPAPEVRDYLMRDSDEPRGEVEETLGGIWCELLNLERVGRQSNFFELGGHSLLAMRMISRIREHLKIDLPVRVIFDAPTVERMSACVEARRRAQSAESELWITTHAECLRRDIDGMGDDDVAAEIAKLKRDSAIR